MTPASTNAAENAAPVRADSDSDFGDGAGPDASAGDPPPWVRSPQTLLWAAAVGGILARVILGACSGGTNDHIAWLGFAHGMRQVGLFALYEGAAYFNHPPIPAYWAMVALLVAEGAGLTFAFVFKLAPIAADVGSMLLLARIAGRRGGRLTAAGAAALFAWNPVAVLISGYHCNTDSVYAFLCLLAAYFIAERRAAFLGGLTLGAAINVKLIPVFLIPPLLASLWPDRRAGARFVGGLAVAALPFVPVLVRSGGAFYERAIGYQSFVDAWGVNFFLLWAWHTPGLTESAKSWIVGYRVWGRAAVAVAVIGLAGLVWWRRRRATLAAAAAAAGGAGDAARSALDAYEISAITLSLFLIVSPGFGLQYLVMVVPVMAAVSARAALAFGLLAAPFVVTLYARSATGSFPWNTLFTGPTPPTIGWLGLPAWAFLVGFAARAVLTDRARPRPTA